MVTQLDSLIWVEVHYVEETTKVSSIQPLTEFSFQFRIPYFGALYLSNQADPVHDPLTKVAEQEVHNKLCSRVMI